MIRQLQQNLLKAQHRMKSLADHHRFEKTFEIGDWVWLKLQPYRQASLSNRGNVKLGPKYFVPFLITDTVGQVAYKLTLPTEALIHATVHVSQLKCFYGQLSHHPYIPDWLRGQHVDTVMVPYKILARKMVKRQNKVAIQYLVQWTYQSEGQTTWVFADVFEKRYPQFQQDD